MTDRMMLGKYLNSELPLIYLAKIAALASSEPWKDATGSVGEVLSRVPGTPWSFFNRNLLVP